MVIEVLESTDAYFQYFINTLPTFQENSELLLGFSVPLVTHLEVS